MESDFTMLTQEFPDRQDIHIYPISDVHLGAAEHMESEFREFRDMILEDKNGYVVIVGDLINNATRSSVSNIFEETMRPREQKRLMAEMLKPVKDRILCAVCGNHERRSGKDADDDPMYDILCKLDIEDRYRENLAVLKLQFGNKDGNGSQNPTYILAVTHGSGGGALTGGTVNRNERFGYVFDGIDMLVVGHSHKPWITAPSKIKVDAFNNKVSPKPFRIVSATSWLDYGGYALSKQLLPSSNTPQIITLYGRKKKIIVSM